MFDSKIDNWPNIVYFIVKATKKSSVSFCPVVFKSTTFYKHPQKVSASRNQ